MKDTNVFLRLCKMRNKGAKKTPRVLRFFAQARIQDKYQRQEVGCTKVGDNDFFGDAESL